MLHFSEGINSLISTHLGEAFLLIETYIRCMSSIYIVSRIVPSLHK
jgi:hypothetical protein